MVRCLLALVPFLVRLAASAKCQTIGNFQGSEDATLYRAGFAFQSSGLVPGTGQPGLILGLSLAGATPAATPLELLDVPDGFGFRPHGLHFDNVTKRLFAVSHSDERHEESIVAFDVLNGSSASPALRFRFALTSPAFEYYDESVVWFLNDLAVVDGRDELFVTQFGPQRSTPTQDKVLFRCTWDEADRRADGRLPANCSTALPDRSLGLNGIAISPSGDRLWVNDLYNAQLWVINVTGGELTREATISLPGVVDNVEYDLASGDLTMGLIGRGTRPPRYQGDGGPGGALVARCLDGARHVYGPPEVTVRNDLGSAWQVSTSLVYGTHVVLGSPWDVGPIACEHRR